jgi:hypothetical protein
MNRAPDRTTRLNHNRKATNDGILREKQTFFLKSLFNVNILDASFDRTISGLSLGLRWPPGPRTFGLSLRSQLTFKSQSESNE